MRRITLDSIPDVLIINILNYLNINELCRMSQLSKLLRNVSESSYLWKENLLRNYRIAIDYSKDLDNNQFNENNQLASAANNANVKLMYKAEHTRVKSAMTSILQVNKEFASGRRIETYTNIIGSVLDLTQVYILIPLTVISILLSIILIALKLDHHSITIFDCCIPLFVLLGYVICSSVVTCFLYYYVDKQYSVLNGIWHRMESPIKFITEYSTYYSNILLISTCVLLIAFILLLCFKLTIHSTIHHTSWGIIFIPLWVLFASYLSKPCVACCRDKAVYLLILLFIWLPFLILGICVAEKLDSMDHYTRPNYSKIKYVCWLYILSFNVFMLFF